VMQRLLARQGEKEGKRIRKKERGRAARSGKDSGKANGQTTEDEGWQKKVGVTQIAKKKEGKGGGKT